MEKNKKALLVIFLTVFIDLVGFGIIIPLVPYLAKKFGGDAVDVGILMSIYSAMQFVFAPFWGKLSDKVGRRPIILMSLFGAGASHLLFAFGQSMTMLIFARALAGFFGANISTAMAYIADVTDSKNRSKGMGLIGAAFGLGFVLGPFIGGLSSKIGLYIGSVPPYGESFAAIVASFICLANFVLAIFVLNESRPKLKMEEKVSRPSRFGLIYSLIHRPLLSKVMFTYFLTVFGMANMEVSMFLFVKDRFQWDVVTASLGFAAVGLVMAFTQGFLFRRLVAKVGERNFLLVGLGLTSLGYFAIGFSHSIISLSMSVLIMSIGSGLAGPSITGMVSLLADENEQGLVMGANQSLAAMSRILGPLLGGWLYRDVSIASPFIAAALISALPLSYLLPRLKMLPDSGRQKESE